MKKLADKGSLRTLAIALLIASSPGAWAQTFSSGSTGADGALNITSFTNITVRQGGVYNYTTVNISGTANYFRNSDNAPLVIFATGDINISGTLNVGGDAGASAGSNASGPTTGARGGPGGHNGGNGGYVTTNPPVSMGATAGHGPGGGAPTATVGGAGGTYGAPAGFVTGVPLVGGSGGGGGVGGTGHAAGASGGGGGGAVLIASTTRIIVSGLIRANGGSGGGGNSGCSQFGGAGSGGTIRLVAPEIIGAGTLQALRGVTPNLNCGAPQPGEGRIRMEAFSLSGFTGATNPIASVSSAPGPVSPAGNPALANVPTLAIATVGGAAIPASPAASYFAPDLALPLGTANPVPVVVTATNTPVGAPTEITVKLMPQGAPSSIAVPAASHTGTFASSSATVNLTLPVGQVSVIQAFAAMTLTGQTASLFPLIDGEPVERVMVAAVPGKQSTLSLLTRSGKQVSMDQLRAEDQLRVAQAWQAMRSAASE